METGIIVDASYSPHYIAGLTREINKTKRELSYLNAIAAYTKARERLTDINYWNSDIRLKRCSFIIVDSCGMKKYGEIQKGDYISYLADNNLKHVLVERLLEVTNDDWQSFAMRLRTVEQNCDGTFSHKETDVTDTLVIERHGNKLISYVHEHSKDAGLKPAENFFQGLRNLFAVRSKTGSQWETLIDVVMK